LPPNVRTYSMGKDLGKSKLKQLFNFYHFILFRHKDYDAVFVHMNPIWVVLGGYIWRLFDKKIIFWYTTKGVTLKLRIATMWANVILTASPESFRLKSKKVIITGHGIDTELFRPSENLKVEDKKLKLLSVGRISPVKNYEVLVDAARILKDKNINFKITMIGEPALESDNNYQEKLKSKIENLKLGENFGFIGKVGHKDLPRYYQQNDIFVHLSKTGSLDKTLLEAMSSGMRVLSSNDAARGFLHPDFIFNEDNPAELANKIVKLKDMSTQENLRNYVVENHNLNKLIDKIAQII